MKGSSGPRDMYRFVEKCWKRQKLTFGSHDLTFDLKTAKIYLWLSWPNLWLDLTNNQRSLVMIFYVLFNAAYRVSLHGPGSELGGRGFKHPRPGARSAPSSAAARRGLSSRICSLIILINRAKGPGRVCNKCIFITFMNPRTDRRWGIYVSH